MITVLQVAVQESNSGSRELTLTRHHIYKERFRVFNFKTIDENSCQKVCSDFLGTKRCLATTYFFLEKENKKKRKRRKKYVSLKQNNVDDLQNDVKQCLSANENPLGTNACQQRRLITFDITISISGIRTVLLLPPPPLPR